MRVSGHIVHDPTLHPPRVPPRSGRCTHSPPGVVGALTPHESNILVLITRKRFSFCCSFMVDFAAVLPDSLGGRVYFQKSFSRWLSLLNARIWGVAFKNIVHQIEGSNKSKIATFKILQPIPGSKIPKMPIIKGFTIPEFRVFADTLSFFKSDTQNVEVVLAPSGDSFHFRAHSWLQNRRDHSGV